MHVNSTGRSKTNNDEEISKILSLEKSLLEIDGAVRRMETQLCIGNVDNLTDYKLRLVEERAHRSRIADTLSRWKTRLGISQRTRLEQLRRNVYLQVRLDAQALKTRIRERLRQRKFEIEKLERSYRQAVNGSYILSYTYGPQLTAFFCHRAQAQFPCRCCNPATQSYDTKARVHIQ